jgi:hypothetical protein
MIINLFTVVKETLWANFQSRFSFPMYFQEIGQSSMQSHAIACDRMLPLLYTVFTSLFSDRTIADCTLGQTVFVARCDIPWAPMLKHPSGRCHLKKGILRTDRSPHTEWKRDSVSKAQSSRPHTPASSIDAIAAPPLAANIAIAIATMGRAMPRRQLTGCIRRGKKSKMSVHLCVLCCYSGTLLSLEIYSVFTGF